MVGEGDIGYLMLKRNLIISHQSETALLRLYKTRLGHYLTLTKKNLKRWGRKTK